MLAVVFLPSCVSMRTINPHRFERIIEVPNVSQIDLYIRTHEWFVRNFTNAGSVIQFQDREEGRIIGRYINVFCSINFGFAPVKSSQIISVDVRDNRVRLVITDPCVSTGKTRTGAFNACTNQIPARCQEALVRSWEDLARSLELHLNTVDTW